MKEVDTQNVHYDCKILQQSITLLTLHKTLIFIFDLQFIDSTTTKKLTLHIYSEYTLIFKFKIFYTNDHLFPVLHYCTHYF